MDVEKIIREYINKTVHMSLATVSGDTPWVCEVHFAYDDDLNLYWRSTASRRHSIELESNPKVAGNIVGNYSLEEGCGGAIYFEGIARCLTDEAEMRETLPFFQRCLNKSDEIIADALHEDGHKIYKVTVKNWYAFGKFGESGSQKYKLEWNNS